MIERRAKEPHAYVAGLIAAGLIAILGFLTWALVFRQIFDGNDTVLNALVGILSTQVSMVVGYYFGSSAANKQLVDTANITAKTALAAGAALAPNAAPDIVLQPGDAVAVAAEDDPK